MAGKVVTSLFVGILMTGTVVYADSVLEASIRTALSQDPRSQLLTPQEYQSLVEVLARKAELQGIAALSFGSSLEQHPQESDPYQVSACEGIPSICYLAWYLGISFTEVWWLVLGFLAGALMILFAYHHHHRRTLQKQKPKQYV